MAENINIQALFRQAAKAKQPIYLLNVYKGVPISYEATLVAVNAAAVKIKTQKYQLVCLYRERETFVQSRLWPDTLHARVVDVDIAATEVVLSNFELVKSRIGDRTRVRVEPQEPVQADLQTKDVKLSFRCELADLSQDGVALYIPSRYFSPQVYARGSAVALELRFPGSYTITEYDSTQDLTSRRPPVADRFSREDLRQWSTLSRGQPEDEFSQRLVRLPVLKIKGTVANAREELTHSRYRVGIRINPDDFSRAVIAQFIFQRQTDIIKELKAVYESLVV